MFVKEDGVLWRKKHLSTYDYKKLHNFEENDDNDVKHIDYDMCNDDDTDYDMCNHDDMCNDDDMYNYDTDDSEDAMYKREPVPAKDWYDIDFSLYKSKLARLQWYGDCKSGAGLINPCAHISAMIIFIWASFEDKINEYLQVSKRDQGIKQQVVNLQKAKEWYAQNVAETYCLCESIWDPNDKSYMIMCESCSEWYHPECVNWTQKECEENKEGWMCPMCYMVINDD